MKINILVSFILFIFFLAACGGAAESPAEPVDNRADIRGSITSVTPAAGGDSLGSILIEGQIEADTGFDRASVTITADTALFEQDAQGRRPITFDALQTGQTAQARFTGPVAESYPVQAVAEEVVVLK